MKILPLYTGNGVSLSPHNAEGRFISNYVRLVAEKEKAITNGEIITDCIDILTDDISKWTDCEVPTTGENTPLPEPEKLIEEV